MSEPLSSPVKLKELCDYLESIAPLHLQESYDNSGLIVGHPETEVKAVLCCLDATEEVLREAQSTGCNVVVAHHPIVFRGLKRFNGLHYVERAVMFAARLDLMDTTILRPHEPGADVGAGLIGLLKAPVLPMDFLRFVCESFQIKTLRHTAILKEKWTKIALCGGSGSFLIQDAMDSGADLYISADIKYHEYFEANAKVTIADIGHYESEFFTIEHLAGLISEKFRNFATHCTKMNTNPVQYL
jgi:putative NIF3 family GTP cyclohydrolase 1 type 2